MTIPNNSIIQLPASAIASSLNLANLFRDAVGAEVTQVRAGEKLLVPDQAVTKVYAIETGQVAIQNRQGLTITYLGPESLIGARELSAGHPCDVSAEVVEQCTLIALPADHFQSLIRVNEELRQAVSAAVTALTRQIDLVSILTELLGELPPMLWDTIAANAQWLQISSGDRLLIQGETTPSLFLVVRGRLQRRYAADGAVLKEPRPDDLMSHNRYGQPAGHLEAGETLGNFLDPEPNSATVVAVRESTVVEFPNELCQQFWQAYPHLALPFLRQATNQQRTILATLDARPIPPTTLALIPASASVDMVSFLDSLTRAMDLYSSVQTITRQGVDTRYNQRRVADIPAHHPLHPSLMDWLDLEENDCDHLLYIGDTSWTEWTRRCLRQADRILLVLDASRSPEPTLIEQAVYALGLDQPIELIFLHPSTTKQPEGTLEWLEKRPTYNHYHVRSQNRNHFERVARRITGNATALVLSGGGAKGYAHLGVLQMMDERGIPIDVVGGTSMGSVVGAAPSLEWSFDKALTVYGAFTQPKSLFDYTLPVVSLFAADKINEILREQLGEVQIEDLWCPYFAVSTDLTGAAAKVHRRGPLWRAVRASASIPAIFPPVIDEDDHVLVDGGIMNNFPVEEMRKIVGSGRIIGVNVGHEDTNQQAYAYDASISGWKVLRSRLDPRAEKLEVPSLASILVRSVMVNNEQLMEKEIAACDLLVTPEVQHIGLLDFAAYEEVVALGYAAAQAAWD